LAAFVLLFQACLQEQKPMKVYIEVDIEGVAGVVSFEDRKCESYENITHRHRIYRLLTGEVNAAVRGCKAAGADTIYICDHHGAGYNILFEELEPGCEIIHGRQTNLKDLMPFMDTSFDALVCVGMHAMAYTPYANLPHSKWQLNGGEVFMSECSMAAAVAGYFDIPAVFVSGDQAITGELREKIPAIETCQVKEALSPYAARCLMPADAQARIEAGVTQALLRRKDIPPYKVPGPPYALNLIDNLNGRPQSPMLEEDIIGDDFLDVVTRAITSFPWSPNRGSQELDGYKYPTNRIP
jgi:D-amino peptidase